LSHTLLLGSWLGRRISSSIIASASGTCCKKANHQHHKAKIQNSLHHKESHFMGLFDMKTSSSCNIALNRNFTNPACKKISHSILSEYYLKE
jgi:hypothetical protein